MTELRDRICAQIAQTGPISVAEYMTTCLLHPTLGYYTMRDPLGAAGDFTTAPEISQMFGEMIGLCLAQAWLDQGAPARFTLAELGPGRGTLMADILRATKSVIGFHKAAQITMVEASPVLKDTQKQTLGAASVTWCDSAADLPDNQPLFLVANEFFDALPIRQFLREGQGWRERLIFADGAELGFGLGPASAQPALAQRLADAAEGDLIELCDAAEAPMAALSQRIADNGGAALIIDYGDWASKGDTFQALKSHQSVDPLTNCGEADLTAHVDFAALSDIAKLSGAVPTHMQTQGMFLELLGITARAQTLAQSMQGEVLDTHIAAHRRLTHPDEMGGLFKVLGVLPSHDHHLAGLEN